MNNITPVKPISDSAFSSMSIISTKDQQSRMSSREIAVMTGKNHFHVKRDLLSIFEQLEINPEAFKSEYKDKWNRSQTEYLLDKRISLNLVSGYNAKIRDAIICRWQKLETEQFERKSKSLSVAVARNRPFVIASTGDDELDKQVKAIQSVTDATGKRDEVLIASVVELLVSHAGMPVSVAQSLFRFDVDQYAILSDRKFLSKHKAVNAIHARSVGKRSKVASNSVGKLRPKESLEKALRSTFDFGSSERSLKLSAAEIAEKCGVDGSASVVTRLGVLLNEIGIDQKRSEGFFLHKINIQC